jgi:hypothetical protein
MNAYLIRFRVVGKSYPTIHGRVLCDDITVRAMNESEAKKKVTGIYRRNDVGIDIVEINECIVPNCGL